MNKRELALLERAYKAEVKAALSNHVIHLIQTRSALAEKMVEEGYLTKCKMVVSGVTIEGYELSHLGRTSYCMTEY